MDIGTNRGPDRGQVAEIEERIGRLTEAQRDVLRLIALRRTSKEIARELKISPVTVDQRVKRIQQILGASSRSEAARFLLATQACPPPASDAIYEQIIYRPSGLSGDTASRQLDPPLGERNPAGGGDADMLRKGQARYSIAPDQSARTHPLVSVLEEMRRRSVRDPATKTLVIAAIAIVTILAFALLVNLVEGVSRLI